MIQGKWFAPGEDISPLVSVREAIFARGADDLDPLSWNALIYEDGVPCAAGRIWYRDGAYWLGDIGVLEAFRGRKLGDLALRLLLFKAQSHAAREIRLRCPEDTEGFFARLGFRPVSRGSGTVEMSIRGEDADAEQDPACDEQTARQVIANNLRLCACSRTVDT